MLLPFRKFVVARAVPPEEKTKSGLFIPETAQVKLREAIVVRCGPDVVAEEVLMYARILFADGAEVELEYGGEKFLIIYAPDILAILEP